MHRLIRAFVFRLQNHWKLKINIIDRDGFDQNAFDAQAALNLHLALNNKIICFHVLQRYIVMGGSILYFMDPDSCKINRSNGMIPLWPPQAVDFLSFYVKMMDFNAKFVDNSFRTRSIVIIYLYNCVFIKTSSKWVFIS